MVAVATLAGGAFLGYLVRLTEFRRERRLETYAQFIGTFLTAAHEGASLYSWAMARGGAINDPELVDETKVRWEAWGQAAGAFETATAQLRLIGGDTGRRKSEELEDFITANVRSVPPLHHGDRDRWGEAATVGPAQIDKDAVRLAREFADETAPEITRWLPRGRRRH